jgi:hypothetical protein
MNPYPESSDNRRVPPLQRHRIRHGRGPRFYRDALGLEESERLSFDDEAFGTFVGIEGVDVGIVFLDASDERLSAELGKDNNPSG